MPDFYGRLVSLMNMQAQTNLMQQEAQDYQSLNQERQLNLQQARQRIADDQLTRQLMMDAARGGRNATNFRGDQPVEGGDPYITGLQAQLQREQADANYFRQAADATAGRVSLDYTQKLQKDAQDAEGKVLATQREIRLAQKDMLQQIGGQAGTVHDDDTLRQAYQKIATIDPMLARSLDLDKDTNGIPYYGEKSKRAMNNLFQSAMTPVQQMDRSIKLQDEMRKDSADRRADAKEQREEQQADQRAALTRAQVGATEALQKEREQRTKQIEAKTARLDNIASKPATKQMVDSARNAIKADADFKDAKFDQTLDAFSGAVADRANKIKADAARSGDDMDMNEARLQAIDELRAGVKTTPGKEGIPILGWFASPATATYTTGQKSAPAAAPSKAIDMPANPTKDSLKSGQLYNTPKGPLIWNGTVFVSP